MTATTVHPLIPRFSERIAYRLLNEDQGHDELADGGLGFEAAWYRDGEQSWELWLAVRREEGKDVETPAGTRLQINGASDPTGEVRDELVTQLQGLASV